jgi:hypothetical protein
MNSYVEIERRMNEYEEANDDLVLDSIVVSNNHDVIASVLLEEPIAFVDCKVLPPFLSAISSLQC